MNDKDGSGRAIFDKRFLLMDNVRARSWLACLRLSIMFFPPTSRTLKLRIRAQESLRWVLVWVLCLCAWRGPLPVVHCHDFNLLGAVTDTENDWQLAEHIAACHPDACTVDEHACWHVHFVLPIPGGHSHSDQEFPSGGFDFSQLMTHDVGEQELDSTVVSPAVDVLADFVGSHNQPAFGSGVPKLIPLAPPRQRPSRVSPRIYYCVAQC